MSVFTQFTGNAVPFGQPLTLQDYRDNPTVGGIEYLRYGVLKSSTGYSSLLADWPMLGINVNTGSTYTQGAGNVTAIHVLTDGTRYYSFTQATNVFARYGTNLTSAWTTSLTGAPTSQSLDAFRFGAAGTVLISVGKDSTTNAYISGTTATAFTASGGQVGAANTAGTLGVIAASGVAAAGQIFTSTNGTSWTSRTPSGAALNNIYVATWSPIGNCFIYVDQIGNVATTTDGFTLTSRGSIGVAPNVPSSAARIQTAINASSASSTLMTITTSNNYSICRTTDGVNFTTTPTTTLFGAGYTTLQSLSYFNSAYYACAVGVLFKSTDEGLTWSRLPHITQSPYIGLSLHSVNSLNSNLVVSWSSSGNSAIYGVISGVDTAAYIGVVPPSTTAYSTNTYSRIK